MPNYLELEVTLKSVSPRIWRRFLLRDQATFYDLHKAILDASQWWQYDVFCFRAKTGEELAGEPSGDELLGRSSDTPDPTERKFALHFAEPGVTSCIYEYDLGDTLYCDVVLVRGVTDPQSFKRRLLGGERAFPFDDCGGIDGYKRVVELVKAGKNPWNAAQELFEWPPKWAPEQFDLQEVKRYFDRGWRTPVPEEGQG